MIGGFICAFVVISGALFLGYLWITASGVSNLYLPWERRDFSRLWHHVSAWRDLYLCGAWRPYFEPPAERTAVFDAYGSAPRIGRTSVCRTCQLRAQQLKQGDRQ